MTAIDRAHYYQDCADPDCMMFGCRAYKTGYRDGYDEGYSEGYAQGLLDAEPKTIYVYVHTH